MVSKARGTLVLRGILILASFFFRLFLVELIVVILMVGLLHHFVVES